jgi:hypothetical protein
MIQAEAECHVCGQTYTGPVLIVMDKMRDHVDSEHPDVNGILYGPR